ncbi:hypothetical protein Xen7305DRAFT_00011310 [Xenococcus sp. PCC 7305]|uniref:DUF1800 domain-containing protein n=1 Tax=Xenococcus sp. PCC 7305 TaxID=102125 RepID=UPI0002ACCFF5|nr:DUF1800 domain-containing protein [Xenococcus sp. PCC 7305]ELS01427.1 hypothetical protein Xen7305DRAFT_00011310 [Xenococcus sp. PCC 7305]
MKKKLLNWSLILTCVVMFWFGLLNHQQTTGSTENTRLIHGVERLSFGLAPGDITKVKQMGFENYLQSQLHPKKGQKNPAIQSYWAKLDTVKRSPMSLLKESQQYNANFLRRNGVNPTTEEQKKLQKKLGSFKRKTMHQAQDAHLIKGIFSPNQLQEVMVDFWFNHFNVYGQKKIIYIWLADYEQEIREHALGNFRDLLDVTAHHPAMLLYLDNDLNINPNSPAAQKKNKGLNENYARELMELHTLGVNGGYTQEDVITLARIFTGWSVDYSGKNADENGFRFFKVWHDNQDKTFLGNAIQGSGLEEGEQALDILANHPATARFISYKLAQYFVADQPPETLVKKLQNKFLESQGNITAVLNVLFHSEEFNNPQYYEQKFKTPYQYLVSLVRAGDITPDIRRMKGMLHQLSMPIYRCETPDGYKNTKQAWLNPEAMLRRVSIATSISNGILNKKQPVKFPRLKVTLGNNFSQHTKNAIAKSPPHLRSALALGSPEMMNK